MLSVLALVSLLMVKLSFVISSDQICVGAKSVRGVWNDYSYLYQLYNVRCYGNESSLLDCQYDTIGSCSLYYAAVAVICQPKSQ